MLCAQTQRSLESALREIAHARRVMSEPHAPMHRWPIEVIESSTARLRDLIKVDGAKVLMWGVEVNDANLPDASTYPLLRSYLVDIRDQAAKEETLRLTRVAQAEKERLYRESPEYKQEQKRLQAEANQIALRKEEERLDALRVEMARSIERISELQAVLLIDQMHVQS